MTPDMKLKLKYLLKLHDSSKNKLYADASGRPVPANDMSLPELDSILERDIDFFEIRLGNCFDWYKDLSEPRQAALVDMCFMGFKKLLELDKMISYLSQHDYDNATDEFLKSDWAQKVGKRSDDLAMILVSGEFQQELSL
jgi:GH24 family phage-related lysozyme (muramidase)